MSNAMPVQQNSAIGQLQSFSDQHLNLAINYVPVAVIAINHQAQITAWNLRATQLFGFDANEVTGKQLQQMPPALFRTLEGLYQHASTGQPIHQFEIFAETATHELVDLAVSSIPIIQPGTQQITGIALVLQNLTPERNEHRSRQASENRLSAIAANLPGAVCELVYHHREQNLALTYISDGVERLFGTPATALTETPQAFADLFPSNEFSRLLSTLATAAEKNTLLRFEGKVKQALLTSQKPLHTNDDEDFEDISLEDELPEYWLHIAATPRSVSDNVTIWEGIIIDISQQKDIEQRLIDSEKQLRGLNKHIEKAKENERAAVAREIHDDIGGTLTKIKVDLSWLRKNLKQDESLMDKLNDIDQLVNHLVQSSTRISRNLRPGILDYGIVPAIEWQAKEFQDRTSIPVKVSCNDEDLTLDVEQSTAIFRVFQESLTNIMKHAEASQVDVEIFVNKNSVTLDIRDNGKGLAGIDLNKTNSFGIRGMMERIRAIGGWLDISGDPGVGTTTMISIPRKKPQ